jgi:hypothetical protein
MTRRAAAFAVEHRSAATGVADLHRAGIDGAHVAEIRDNPGKLRTVKLEGRHQRSRNAVRNEVVELLIRNSIPERAAPQVYAAD